MKLRSIAVGLLALISSSMASTGSIHSGRRFVEGFPAVIHGTNSSVTYFITQNSTMTIAVNGGAPIWIVFDTYYGPATPGTLVGQEINEDLAAAGAAALAYYGGTGGSHIIVSSTLFGASSSIKITDGVNSPASVLGLSTTLTVGSQASATLATKLNSLVDNTSDYVPGDRINLTGTHPSGFLFSSQYVYGSTADGTTMGDLVDFLNSAFIFDSASPSGATAFLTSSGHIWIQANGSPVSRMQLQVTDEVLNVGVTNWKYHPFIP